MPPIRVAAITLLSATVFAGGCIAAVRKGVGTLRGAQGSMTITQDDGDIRPTDGIQSVNIQVDQGVEVPSQNIALITKAVRDDIEGHRLWNPGEGTLQLTLDVTRFVNRPGKKVLDINATLTRNQQPLGQAEMSVNLNGFGSSEEVADALGKSMIELIDHLNDN